VHSKLGRIVNIRCERLQPNLIKCYALVGEGGTIEGMYWNAMELNAIECPGRSVRFLTD